MSALGKFIGVVSVCVPVGLGSAAHAQTNWERIADFTNLGTFATSQLNVCSLVVTADNGTAPADVNVLNLNGLGVVGGLSIE